MHPCGHHAPLRSSCALAGITFRHKRAFALVRTLSYLYNNPKRTSQVQLKKSHDPSFKKGVAVWRPSSTQLALIMSHKPLKNSVSPSSSKSTSTSSGSPTT